ncbi:MAG TPA: hypothetical protein VG738_05370 [Chitinophagaceae bacterium]|nr:hypothetical protein [Chitinophagaceae bacterium]
MKLVIVLFLLLDAGQLLAQTNAVTAINISLPANPDADVANWGTGTSVLVITASASQANERISSSVEDSRILITIKKDGVKVCGDYTAITAPAADFNSVTKLWSGTNAVSLLGKGCILQPGDYELSVQFFGSGAAGPIALSDEKTKAFTIRGNDQQRYQAPQGITPAGNAVLTAVDIKKPVTFRWTPVVPPPPGSNVVYHLKVFEVLKGQAATQAVAANSPVLATDITTPQYIWQLPIEYKSSDGKKTFAWTVQATDKEGKQAYGPNSGVSEAMVFTTGGNPQPASTCGLNITTVLTCAGGGSYNFTATCLNTADPSTDPGCVISVTSLTLPAGGGTTITITSSLPSIPPGQSGVVTGVISAAPQTPIMLVNFTGPNNPGSYGVALSLPTAPQAPGTITGPGSVCQSPASITYSISPVNGATSYNWAVPAGALIVSGQGTNSITVSFQNSSPGNICVSTVNSCGTSTASCKPITISPLPAQPGAITGLTTPCAGSQQTYSVPNISGLTYQWIFPVAWTPSTSTTSSATATAAANSGTIQVFAVSGCGMSAPQTLAVTGATLPGQPVSFTGNTTVCFGSQQAYSVANVNGINYAWQFPVGWTQLTGGNTNAVTTTAANTGNITITPFNVCGTGPAKTVAVTTTPLAVQPGPITGNAGPCHGSTQVYSVPNIAGLTYQWNFPAGWTIISGGTTSTVTVTAGTASGTISVAAVNACGSGPARMMLTMPVLSTPAAPGAITGASTVCKAQQASYSISPVSGATSYTWLVTSGQATITAGQGSASALVTFGNTAGSVTLCVKANNTCGSSTQTCKTITVTGPPSPPLPGPGTFIQANQFTANWTYVPGATYRLDVSTNASFTSFVPGYQDVATGTVNSFFITAAVTGLQCNTTYYYRVRAVSNCGTSINSNIISVTTSTLPPQGNWANLATAATGITLTQFTANWNAATDAAYYKLDVSTNANFTSFVAGYNNLTVGTGNSYTVTGLATNGCPIYYYRVRAVSACGGISPNSNAIMVTLPAPHGVWIEGAGSYTFTVGQYGSGANIEACPGQTVSITMEIWGAGGGGAAGEESPYLEGLYKWTGGTGGSGGGGGGYDKKVVNVVVPSIGMQIYNVTVGHGGAGGTNPYGGSGGNGEITKVTTAGSTSPFLYTTPASGGIHIDDDNTTTFPGGDGITANHWKGADGTPAQIPTSCSGSDGGLGGAGGGPGRTGPGYFNDGGNGGHGGYNRYVGDHTHLGSCLGQSQNNGWSYGSPGSNGRVVFTW